MPDCVLDTGGTSVSKTVTNTLFYIPVWEDGQQITKQKNIEHTDDDIQKKIKWEQRYKVLGRRETGGPWAIVDEVVGKGDSEEVILTDLKQVL